MSLSIKRRRRHWYAVGQVNGRRVNQSLQTTDRTVAEALKRDLELQILAGGRLSRLRWTDYRDEFLRWITPQIAATTAEKYAFIIQRFSRFLSDRVILELQHIQPATLAEFADERRKDVHPTRRNTVGPEGIKSDMRILHRVFAYAEECGYLDDNPVRFKRLAVTGGKTLPFTEDEVSKILQDDVVTSLPQLRAIVLTFLFTGFRISDVIGLPLQSLDLKNDRLILRTQKRGKMVSLAIHPDLHAALETHLLYRTRAQQLSPLVFTTAPGKPMNNLDATLRRIFKRAGIQHGHAHRFRDTFAVRLLAQGASLYDVSKMLGINMGTAERHYAPYVQELQDRSARLIQSLKVPIPPDPEKVVQFCTPLSSTSINSSEQAAKVGGVQYPGAVKGKS